MSWDLGGHSISGWSFSDARPIQRPGNAVFRYWRTSQWKWAGLLSSWNMNVSMFCNRGFSHGCNMPRYVMPVTVSSAKENGPYTFWLEMHKTHCFKSHYDAAHRHVGFNPYPTAFPYGNGMVLHFYQQQESSTTKTIHKVINKGLKTYV